MKKFFTMALMSLAVFAVSCSKDSPEELIQGTWVLESYTFTENGQTHSGTTDECERKGSYVFSAGTVTVVSCDEERQGDCQCSAPIKESYSISGDKITSKGKNGDETATFSVDKNTLTIVGEGYTQVFKRK